MQMPIRPRRLRATPAIRRLVREVQLTSADFIYPMFAVHGSGVRTPIPSMPGIDQLSVDEILREAEKAVALDIPGVLLFGIPASKDPVGLENFAEDGIVQQATRKLKAEFPDLLVVTDVCLCEYTDHGHCGLIGDHHHEILNDETLDILQKVSLSHARAGADIVAPSGMMDGMIAAIRSALDEEGFTNLTILSYAIKYASAFYGPFRDAADGAPKFGDRKTHQMDPANIREAVREVALDLAEGADMVMVKPALAYLDIIRQTREQCAVPVAAYNVSGEYAMVKAAAANGWLDERAIVLEKLTGIKRAGADIILTYHALEAAQWLKNS
ncbi:MAG: porphobilinogen synthase [Chloroflexota bacterium]